MYQRTPYYPNGFLDKPPNAFSMPKSTTETQSFLLSRLQKKRYSRRNILVGLTLILVVAFAAGWLFHKEANYDTSASSITYASASDEELQALLNEKTEASRLWIGVASKAHISAGSDIIAARTQSNNIAPVLSNLPENSRDITYSLFTEDGTEIYKSDLLKPGQSITEPKLRTTLDPGTYTVTAQAQGYDPSTHEKKGGMVSAHMNLVVE